MKVSIKEKEHEYHSDYPDGWLFSSGDNFKFPVFIGNYPCFIKRFEKNDPFSISGWNLMVKLKNVYEPNLVRVYDIASVEEKSKRVYYVFYEYLKGNTLDNLISRNVPINLTRLTNDLFSALTSLQFHEHWFADFIEKNILAEDRGRFVLMDLDSAQPSNKLPDNDMYGSKDYWVLVFAFYKKILKYNNIKISDISGHSLNQLQIIFMIFRLKTSFDALQQQYRHTDTFNELPAALDKIDPAVREVFTKVYNERNSPQYANRALEIKELIERKIINYEQFKTFEQTTPVDEKSVIREFESDIYAVEEGETFELRWIVENAGYIKLYRNEAFDSRFTGDEKSVLKVAYCDDDTNTISYKLIAYKNGDQVQSAQVKISIIKDPVNAISPLQPSEPANRNEKPIDYYLKFIGIPLSVLLIVVLMFIWHRGKDSGKVIISGIRPMVIMFANEQTVTIYGKNLPADKNDIKVILNNVPALIQSYSRDSLTVSYPENGDKSLWRGSVAIGIIVKNDTSYAPHYVKVLKNLMNSPAR